MGLLMNRKLSLFYCLVVILYNCSILANDFRDRVVRLFNMGHSGQKLYSNYELDVYVSNFSDGPYYMWHLESAGGNNYIIRNDQTTYPLYEHGGYVNTSRTDQGNKQLWVLQDQGDDSYKIMNFVSSKYLECSPRRCNTVSNNDNLNQRWIIR